MDGNHCRPRSSAGLPASWASRRCRWWCWTTSSETQRRAYILADNKLAMKRRMGREGAGQRNCANSETDARTLALIGFSDEELEALPKTRDATVGGLGRRGSEAPAQPVTQPGDRVVDRRPPPDLRATCRRGGYRSPRLFAPMRWPTWSWDPRHPTRRSASTTLERLQAGSSG